MQQKGAPNPNVPYSHLKRLPCEPSESPSDLCSPNESHVDSGEGDRAI